MQYEFVCTHREHFKSDGRVVSDTHTAPHPQTNSRARLINWFQLKRSSDTLTPFGWRWCKDVGATSFLGEFFDVVSDRAFSSDNWGNYTYTGSRVSPPSA